MESSYPFFLGNRPVTANRDLPVLHKYDGQVATQVALADRNAVLSAIASAESASAAMRELPAYEREAILQHCVQRFTELREQLAQDLCIEAGKPIRDCRGEVARLIDTFKIAAAETTQIGGELVPLDLTPRAKGYTGLYQRFPIGPCSFITPFNFPLNLVAHKVAPAIAAGCPFVLKPATQTPVGALTIASILAETDLPPGAFSVIPCRIEDADPLVEDPRLRLLSFTGSPEVGWRLKARAGRKKVVLELGGN
ncbi:MAG: aldehyde dehydrogenase family protein, partial [Planctomycetes bacterium]|nr:aldehyde dehydrogenase family protein [Planctomycetota bacterium]